MLTFNKVGHVGMLVLCLWLRHLLGCQFCSSLKKKNILTWAFCLRHSLCMWPPFLCAYDFMWCLFFVCVQTHVCLCFFVCSNPCLFLHRNTYVLYLWWTYAFNNEFILRIYSPLAYWTLCRLLGVPDCLMGCCVACLESVSVSFGRSSWCSCWFTWLLLSTWQCSPVSTLPFLGIAHRLLGSLLMFLCVCLTLLARCSSVCLGHSLLLLPLYFACSFRTISFCLLGGLFLIHITVSCRVFVCTSPFPLTLSLYLIVSLYTRLLH